MFRTGILSIIRSLNTVFAATDICHTSYVDCLLERSGSILTSPADSRHNCMTNTSCCEYSIQTPDDGQYSCPKHIEFFTKIMSRNLAFIIRIYHDARSSEYQKISTCWVLQCPCVLIMTWKQLVRKQRAHHNKCIYIGDPLWFSDSVCDC